MHPRAARVAVGEMRGPASTTGNFANAATCGGTSRLDTGVNFSGVPIVIRQIPGWILVQARTVKGSTAGSCPADHCGRLSAAPPATSLFANPRREMFVAETVGVSSAFRVPPRYCAEYCCLSQYHGWAPSTSAARCPVGHFLLRGN